MLTDFERQCLQLILKQGNVSKQHRQRIKIMFLADEGKNQTQISQELRASPRTIKDCVFMAKIGNAVDYCTFSLGRPKIITQEYLERLRHLVSGSPRNVGYCFNTWSATCLSRHLERELGIKVSDRHINRLLQRMGLSTKPAKINQS